ncbi:MAG: hypothetical protein JNM94_05305 [Phycisphaerae bacterium]|nr:hypothetical protein [Phycisphaerae bacterium]
MQTLLAKDLRLAGDALRPALLILVGFVVGLALLSAVPESILPLAGSLRVSDALYALPQFLVVASGPFALVATAVTLRGDRRHGAALLAGALPVSAARQGASALVVLLVVTAALPAVGLVAGAIRLLTIGDSAGRLVLWAAPTAALLASACGTAYALAAGRPGRSPAMTIGVASLLVVAAAAAGFAAGWIPIALNPGLGAVRLETRGFPDSSPYLLAAAFSATIGGAIGSGVAGLANLFGAIGGRSRWAIRAIATLGVLACGVGGAIGAVSLDDRIQSRLTYQRAWVSRLSPVELAERVRALPPLNLGSEPLKWNASTADAAAFDAARTHVAAIAPLDLDGDPVARALRERESYETSPSSFSTLWYLVPQQDPRRLPLVLDSMARFPRDSSLRWLGWFSVLPEMKTEMPELPTGPGERIEAAILSGLRTALETLIREGHPESERMKAVLDVLPPAATTP